MWQVGRGREPWERSEAGGVNGNEQQTQTKIQAWSSLVFHRCHSSFNPSEAPPWDSRPVSGAGVVHYHLLHRPRSVPTALGPAPLATVNLVPLIGHFILKAKHEKCRKQFIILLKCCCRHIFPMTLGLFKTIVLEQGLLILVASPSLLTYNRTQMQMC